MYGISNFSGSLQCTCTSTQ
jgi:hypothetical protein